jgi:4-alpha-glucanotransferase
MPHRDSAALADLAALIGIPAEYHDARGTLVQVPESTRRAALAAMGHTDAAAALAALGLGAWTRLLEPAMVVREDEQPPAIALHFPLNAGDEDRVELHVDFRHEDGTGEERSHVGVVPVEEREIDGARHVRVDLANDVHRPLGYHDVFATVSAPGLPGLSARQRLVVVPRRCHEPEGRAWGLTVNLYAMRSARNWGIGDLTDLRDLGRFASADLGASFVGINPLHALPNSLEHGVSPYGPISRMYRNFIYLDVERVAGKLVPGGYHEAEDEITNCAREARALHDAEFIDYKPLSLLKHRALRAVFPAFVSALGEGRLPEFTAWREAEGPGLELFAAFMALDDWFGGGRRAGWPSWPEEYHDPEGEAVASFRRTHAEDILYYEFVQWAVHCQMAEAAGAFHHGEVPRVGVYTDLAVGSSPLGSDAWCNAGVFARGMTVGAPPDDFSPSGQNWLFPPLSPGPLRETGYALFAATVRKAMEHAGAMRIDHALGLFRLFWIPEGRPASEGAYVAYPWRDLLGIVALESVRARCIVIAEDLGTIGPEVRGALAEHGMLSYRLLYFERDWAENRFLPPEAWPAPALGAVNTHDLPTLLGYLAGRDIEERRHLGLYATDADWEHAVEERKADRERLLEAVGPWSPGEQDVFAAVHAFLAHTPCALVGASLDDAAGATRQQNMPGVATGYPNWQRRLPASLEDLADPATHAGQRIRRLAEIFKAAGR